MLLPAVMNLPEQHACRAEMIRRLHADWASQPDMQCSRRDLMPCSHLSVCLMQRRQRGIAYCKAQFSEAGIYSLDGPKKSLLAAECAGDPRAQVLIDTLASEV